MPKKTYRPKAEAKGLRVTASLGGGRVLDVGEGAKESFPYSTEDEAEQFYLDGLDFVTDRPAPKRSGSASASKASKAPTVRPPDADDNATNDNGGGMG